MKQPKRKKHFYKIVQLVKDRMLSANERVGTTKNEEIQKILKLANRNILEYKLNKTTKAISRFNKGLFICSTLKDARKAASFYSCGNNPCLVLRGEAVKPIKVERHCFNDLKKSKAFISLFESPSSVRNAISSLSFDSWVCKSFHPLKVVARVEP